MNDRKPESGLLIPLHISKQTLQMERLIRQVMSLNLDGTKGIKLVG